MFGSTPDFGDIFISFFLLDFVLQFYNKAKNNNNLSLCYIAKETKERLHWHWAVHDLSVTGGEKKRQQWKKNRMTDTLSCFQTLPFLTRDPDGICSPIYANNWKFCSCQGDSARGGLTPFLIWWESDQRNERGESAVSAVFFSLQVILRQRQLAAVWFRD